MRFIKAYNVCLNKALFNIGMGSLIICINPKFDFTTSIFNFRRSPPEVFLGKVVLKICSKFTRETPMPKCDLMKLVCTFYTFS